MSWWDEYWRRRRRFWDPFYDIDRMIEEIMRDLRRFMEDFERRFIEEREEESKTEKPREYMKIEGPYVYGFSITIGPDGRPIIREFGNVRRIHGKPSIVEEREPLTDVFEKDDEITVYVEMPGVEKDKIDVKLSDDNKTLIVRASNDKRKYYKEVELPAPVDPSSAKATYRNGVLEVKLKKLKTEERKGTKINID